MKKTVEIATQSRAADLSAPDQEKRTVDLTWTTGAAVRRVDFWTGEPWLEELSTDPAHVRMGRMNSGAPLLNSHASYDLGSVLGVVERASMDGGKGTATARFSRRKDVEPILQDVVDGIIRNVSVGYKVYRFEDVSTQEDIKARIRRMRAVDWEPVEVSLVPVGADAGAGVARADAEKHTCEIEYSERSTAGAPTERDGEAAPQGPPANSLTAIRERFEFGIRRADFELGVKA